MRDFELKSGDYQAKIVVRDTRTGRVGTVIHEFDVPPLDELRVSTPVLSDTRAPSPATEGVPGGMLAVVARREFALGLRPPLPVRGLRGEEGREDGHAPRDRRATW